MILLQQLVIADLENENFVLVRKKYLDGGLLFVTIRCKDKNKHAKNALSVSTSMRLAQISIGAILLQHLVNLDLFSK